MGKKRHDIEAERWWVTYEHPDFGEAQVGFRWIHQGHGIYDVVPFSVQFELFTPADVQEEMKLHLERMRVRSVREERTHAQS